MGASFISCRIFARGSRRIVAVVLKQTAGARVCLAVKRSTRDRKQPGPYSTCSEGHVSAHARASCGEEAKGREEAAGAVNRLRQSQVRAIPCVAMERSKGKRGLLPSPFIPSFCPFSHLPLIPL
eukprot:86875-Chlamydomonas_euryale.AAC.2